MAKHVEFSVPTRELGRANVVFQVRSDGKFLGTLEVSKGALVWRPGKSKKGHKIYWEEFADFAITSNRKE